jgi:hypothetical protein
MLFFVGADPMSEPATPLSPAEATVLLAPNTVKPIRAIKATLLLLLSTGVLHVEETVELGVFRNRRIAHLRIARAPNNPSPDVAALLDAVRAAQEADGRIKDVVAQCRKSFGAMCERYTATWIVPALIDRGLLERRKFLFFKTLHLTSAGERAQAKIKSDLFKADDVARLLKSDPARAAALAATLGTSVLLSDKLTRQFKLLADAMHSHRDGGDAGADVVLAAPDGPFGHDVDHGHADFGSGDVGSFDIGNFDLGGVDLGSLDLGALGSAIDSLDAGFSDAGGHGDGDSGGGDGGSGGH